MVFELSSAGALSLVVLDSAIKAAVLLAGAWAATRFMRKSSAAGRHLVWLLAFAATFLLPVLSTCVPRWRVLPDWTATLPAEPQIALPQLAVAPRQSDAHSSPAPLAETQNEVATFAMREDNPIAAALASLSTLSHRSAQTGEPFWSDWHVWVLTIWAVGATTMLVRLIVGFLRLWQLGRVAQHVEADDWNCLLGEQAAQLGIRRRVTLLQSDAHEMPMTWGVLFPKLLLPAEAATWTAERRRVVLLHELSHIKRHDCAAQWIAHLVRSFHWFNPLAWIALRQATLEREQACDDLVLSAGVKPSAYGEQLLAVARRLPAHGPATLAISMAQGSTLERRMHAILEAGRNRRALTTRIVLAAMALQLALLLPLAALHGADPASTANPPSTADPAKIPAEEVVAATAETPVLQRSEVAPPAAVAADTLPDLEGGHWNLQLNQYARTKRTDDQVILVDLLPFGNIQLDPARFARSGNATTERIVGSAKRGDLYIPEPDVVRPVRGTLMAPLPLRSSLEGDQTVLLKGIAEKNCEQIAAQVIAYAKEHPEIQQHRVAASDSFAIVRPDGRLFVLGVFGSPDALSIQILPIGHALQPPFSKMSERTILARDGDKQGVVFFDIETGKTPKPPFAVYVHSPLVLPVIVEMTPELKAWIKSTHVDLMFYFQETSWSVMEIGMQMNFAGQPNDWDQITTSQAMRVFDRYDGTGRVRDEIPGSESGAGYQDEFGSEVHAFRTRDNTVGILRWIGIHTPARGVKIDYQFVEPPPQPSKLGPGNNYLSGSFRGIQAPGIVLNEELDFLFSDSDFSGANFVDATLVGGTFAFASTRFSKADLTRAKLSGDAAFQKAQFDDAILVGAVLNGGGSGLQLANFNGANLANAKISGGAAALQMASFVNANLTGAIISGVVGTLGLANFDGANLTGATFQCEGLGPFQLVRMNGTNFADADLSAISYQSLSSGIFDPSKPPTYSRKTRFPAGFSPARTGWKLIP